MSGKRSYTYWKESDSDQSENKSKKLRIIKNTDNTISINNDSIESMIDKNEVDNNLSISVNNEPNKLTSVEENLDDSSNISLENRLLSIIMSEDILNKMNNHDNINLLYIINLNLLKLSGCVIRRLLELKKKKECEINNKINLLKNDLIRLNSINYMSNCFSLQSNIIQQPTANYCSTKNMSSNYLKDDDLIIMPEKK